MSLMGGDYGRAMAQKAKYLSDMEQAIEFAMQTWESKKGQYSRLDAAVQGLFIGLGSIPGASIPAAIRDARSRNNEAVIRAAYHHAKGLISMARPRMANAVTDQTTATELAVIHTAIAKAAGLV